MMDPIRSEILLGNRCLVDSDLVVRWALAKSGPSLHHTGQPCSEASPTSLATALKGKERAVGVLYCRLRWYENFNDDSVSLLMGIVNGLTGEER